mmetsp:Transcript_33529/g.78276  ORF Transcript_33529/g.78276 Transcript_33529/m.78276 type:complete len:220 (-) Transcript_33529:646-1305(-)
MVVAVNFLLHFQRLLVRLQCNIKASQPFVNQSHRHERPSDSIVTALWILSAHLQGLLHPFQLLLKLALLLVNLSQLVQDVCHVKGTKSCDRLVRFALPNHCADTKLLDVVLDLLPVVLAEQLTVSWILLLQLLVPQRRQEKCNLAFLRLPRPIQHVRPRFLLSDKVQNLSPNQGQYQLRSKRNVGSKEHLQQAPGALPVILPLLRPVRAGNVLLDLIPL